jgi:hypothetical protein
MDTDTETETHGPDTLTASDLRAEAGSLIKRTENKTASEAARGRAETPLEELEGQSSAPTCGKAVPIAGCAYPRVIRPLNQLQTQLTYRQSCTPGQIRTLLAAKRSSRHCTIPFPDMIGNRREPYRVLSYSPAWAVLGICAQRLLSSLD